MAAKQAKELVPLGVGRERLAAAEPKESVSRLYRTRSLRWEGAPADWVANEEPHHQLFDQLWSMEEL